MILSILRKMDSNSFYIELVSNSESFSNNTVANFKNRINLENKLSGLWEMAVTEVSYTYSWKNMNNLQWIGLNEETIKTNEKSNSLDHLKFINGIQYIREGHYDSLKQLLSEIHNIFLYYAPDKIQKTPYLYYDDVTKYLYIDPGLDRKGNKVLPEFSPTLANLLGFDNYTTVDPKYTNGKIVSNGPPDLKAGLRTLFIYTNHIMPQHIGDVRASILKTVEVPNNLNFGDQVVIKYNNPHYIPLLFNDFEIIEIDIRDSTGDRVPFLFGITLIKLHLRKRQNE